MKRRGGDAFITGLLFMIHDARAWLASRKDSSESSRGAWSGRTASCGVSYLVVSDATRRDSGAAARENGSRT